MWNRQREREGEEDKRQREKGWPRDHSCLCEHCPWLILVSERGHVATVLWYDSLLILRGEDLLFASKMWGEVRFGYQKTQVLVLVLDKPHGRTRNNPLVFSLLSVRLDRVYSKLFWVKHCAGHFLICYFINACRNPVRHIFLAQNYRRGKPRLREIIWLSWLDLWNRKRGRQWGSALGRSLIENCIHLCMTM